MDHSNSTASHFTQALVGGIGGAFLAEGGMISVRALSEPLKECITNMYSSGTAQQIIGALNHNLTDAVVLTITFGVAAGGTYLSVRAEQNAAPTPQA